MKNIFKLYKIVIIIFVIFAIFKIKNQLTLIYSYNNEISILNSKVSDLKKELEDTQNSSETQKESFEDIARKDLKMYYPNETPFKGY